MSERNAVGNWQEVGYVAPGATKSGEDGTTSNFKYIQTKLESGSLEAKDESIGTTWGASNTVALNDCHVATASKASEAHWSIELYNTTNGNSIVYKAVITEDEAYPGACEQLTPSYKLISSKKD